MKGFGFVLFWDGTEGFDVSLVFEDVLKLVDFRQVVLIQFGLV